VFEIILEANALGHSDGGRSARPCVHRTVRRPNVSELLDQGSPDRPDDPAAADLLGRFKTVRDNRLKKGVVGSDRASKSD
jgi:hypothetical protein